MHCIGTAHSVVCQHVILDEIVPQLPTALQEPVNDAVAAGRLKRMPNTFFPAAEQGQSTKEGAFLVGDSWNMRHPLTGGGMTVAFNDVVILRDLLSDVEDFTDWSDMSHALHQWHWRRKQYASTINILSVALYDLFGADGTLSSLPGLSAELTAAQMNVLRFSGQAASSTSSLAATAFSDPYLCSPGTCYGMALGT